MPISENNDYTESEDKMMYELHKIRHEMAKNGLNLKEIRATAAQALQEHGIKVERAKVTSCDEASDFEKQQKK